MKSTDLDKGVRILLFWNRFDNFIVRNYASPYENL